MTLSMRLIKALKYVTTRLGWFFAGWMAAFLSAVIASKGGIRRSALDTGAGEIDD